MQQVAVDWEGRLRERLASPTWKDTDLVLNSLPPVEAIQTLEAVLAEDHRRLRGYWLINIGASLLQVGLPLSLITWLLQSAELPFWAFPLLGSALVLSVILIPRTRFLSLEKSCTRCRNAYSALQRLLPECRTPETIPALLSFLEVATKTPRALHQDLDWAIQKAIGQVLLRLSGEELFALPFALRRELARRAEQPSTSPELSLAILLGLTSARDGLIQPVLRRLARDAWNPRIKQVAAECLQEFGKEFGKEAKL